MRTLRMNGQRKRFTAYDTHSYYFINMFALSVFSLCFALMFLFSSVDMSGQTFLQFDPQTIFQRNTMLSVAAVSPYSDPRGVAEVEPTKKRAKLEERERVGNCLER